MAYLRTAITFFWSKRYPIGIFLQKRVCKLYLVCENGPKIPVGTCFIDLQGKPVQKSDATLTAARTAGWDSSPMLLWTAVAVRRCNRFSIWRLLCYRGPFCKKYQAAKSAYSSQVFKWKCEKAPPSYERVKSVKMAYLSTAVTFFWSRQFPIGKVLWKCMCMLYLMCENEPKIPFPTCFIDVQDGTVHKGGRAKGGQRGPHKRPWW